MIKLLLSRVFSTGVTVTIGLDVGVVDDAGAAGAEAGVCALGVVTTGAGVVVGAGTDAGVGDGAGFDTGAVLLGRLLDGDDDPPPPHPIILIAITAKESVLRAVFICFSLNAIGIKV